MDPPQHTKFRAMFEAPFREDSVDAMRPFIQSTVDDLIGEMERQRTYGGHKGAFDLSEKFSYPLAFRAIYHILGVPPEVRGCLDWVGGCVGGAACPILVGVMVGAGC